MVIWEKDFGFPDDFFWISCFYFLVTCKNILDFLVIFFGVSQVYLYLGDVERLLNFLMGDLEKRRPGQNSNGAALDMR